MAVSMKVLTILQFLYITASYSIMTLLLPSILFYPKLKKLKLAVRFLAYQMIGNFYMMNLVLLLQLLHISNAYTLWIFTVVPFFAAYKILYKKHPIQALLGAVETLKRLAGGQLGIRLFLSRICGSIGSFVGRGVKRVGKGLLRNAPDCVLVAGLIVLMLYLYGTNALTNYGYGASDIPVHNYWINYLSRGKLFVAGVYPFGFHCVLYYLHTVFGIETYVLLRLFWLLQTMMIHFVLLAVVRSLSKSRYTAYLGVGIYTAVNIFGLNTYSRYYSSLPQEFSMLFILPSIYFLFAFLEKKCSELKNPDEEKFAKWHLVLFAMSFSMTLIVHFYGTMIAGLFCIGVAVGYFFRIFRKKYFGRILLAGILSIMIAVLPMAIAFITGTPLQGSLGWGMNVIAGSMGEGEEEESESEPEYEEMPDVTGESETVAPDVAGGTETDSTTFVMEPESSMNTEIVTAPEDGGYTPELEPEPAVPLGERLKGLVTRIISAIWNVVIAYVIPGDLRDFQLAVLLSMPFLCVLAILFFVFRQTDYAARLLSTAAAMGLMSLLLAASRIGLPALMDSARTSIFYAYLLIVAWSFCVDGVLQLLLGWLKKRFVLDIAAVLVIAVFSAYIAGEGLFKQPRTFNALQTNEAVTCLTNIIYDNPNFTWTICSANDELRMGEDYGYHYEVSTFLGQMEHSGGLATITMPTHTVYFFIEKKPLDYAVVYENSGQFISKEGADNPLPPARGITMYQGENRWIEMSRMYYWAQKFEEMYPNEMDVYYETENFVCYRVVQNDYRLYNFAIDYGYNTKEYQREVE